LPVLLVANTQGPSKVLYALVTGRLAAAYIINDLTTGVDPDCVKTPKPV
jgi:hypothetical protein